MPPLPLPMTTDPTGSTLVLDVEALFDQMEQEDEERECFSAAGRGLAAPGPATSDE